MGWTFSLISVSALLWFILGFYNVSKVYGNAEGDALYTFKTQLNDPYNVLGSWNATEVNPCAWFHVTCNGLNSVTRIDLGNAGLSGQLIPQLGQLMNLQHLVLYSNNFTGRIPNELGNLTRLVILDLYLNRLEGDIPTSLGNLKNLSVLRLNNNTLTGTIPSSLTTISFLQVIDLSSNLLTGTVPFNGSFSVFTPMSFTNNPDLRVALPAPAPPDYQFAPGGNRAIGADALVSSGLAIVTHIFFSIVSVVIAICLITLLGNEIFAIKKIRF